MNEERTVPYTHKKNEVAPGIQVICGGRVTVADSGHESAHDQLVIITKRGSQELDRSPYFIDLLSAVLEGKEVVVKWTKLEKHNELVERFDTLGHRTEHWMEEVEERRQCEKRIPI